MQIAMSHPKLLAAAAFLLILLTTLIYRSVSLWLESARLAAISQGKAKMSLEPLVQRLAGVGGLPQEELAAQLIQAGLRDAEATARFGRFQGLSLAAAVGSIFLLIIMGAHPGVCMVLGGPILAAGRYLPAMWLRNRVQERQTRISASLPSTVDLVLLCLEAGLGVEQAFQRVAGEIEPMEPVIAEEVTLMLNETTAGLPFPEAVKRMADRINLQELVLLARLVAQGAALGTSLARTLRDYSEASYQRRMLNLDEKAGKLSAATSLPVSACLLPSALLMIGGPAVVMILQTMGMMS